MRFLSHTTNLKTHAYILFDSFRCCSKIWPIIHHDSYHNHHHHIDIVFVAVSYFTKHPSVSFSFALSFEISRALAQFNTFCGFGVCVALKCWKFCDTHLWRYTPFGLHYLFNHLAFTQSFVEQQRTRWKANAKAHWRTKQTACLQNGKRVY